MLSEFFAKGLLMGLLTSLPLGPIGIIVIQRTINRDRWAGFFSGVGAAISDTIFACIAGLSVSFIISFIVANENLFRIVGAAILLVLGLFLLLTHPERYTKRNGKKKNSYFKDASTVFLITISNPLIIFVHLAFFTGFGIVLSVKDVYLPVVFISGFFIGALSWWFSLTGIINLFRKRFTLKICLWLNRIAGVCIILFVLVSLVISLFQKQPNIQF